METGARSGRPIWRRRDRRQKPNPRDRCGRMSLGDCLDIHRAPQLLRREENRREELKAISLLGRMLKSCLDVLPSTHFAERHARVSLSNGLAKSVSSRETSIERTDLNRFRPNKIWWARRASIPHGVSPQRILSPPRLPVPTLAREYVRAAPAGCLPAVPEGTA